MKPFLSCNSPVRIGTLKGAMLVSCGKCVQCRVSRQKRLELLLSLETQQHKYCELINLTYNDEFLPWVDFSGYLGFADNSVIDEHQRIVLPLHLGDRYIKRYNPKTRTYMDVIDKSALNRFVVSPIGKLFQYTPVGGFDTFTIDYTYKVIKQYNERVNEYFQKFPFRKRGLARQENHVPILFSEDITKFIDRLQKWCISKFGAKTRYFAVGEYGTNSLRPHWHLVLFHDSLELRKAFQDVYVYPNSTSTNPRECSRALFGDKVWRFGDITSTTTDGYASSYLSSYLNSSSYLPTLLASFPQKTFKSIFLGDNRDKQYVASLFQERRFEELTTYRIKGRDSVERIVPLPSSSYFRYHIGYSFDGLQTIEDTYSLLLAAKRYLSEHEINIFDDYEVYKQYRVLSSVGIRSDIRFRSLVQYMDRYAFSVYYNQGTINPLKSVFYASKKLYKMSAYLGFSPWQYLHYVRNFESWLDYRNLIKHFEMLENDSNFSYQYYSTFDDALGIPNFKLYKQTSLFQKQQFNANVEYTSSIKHRNVVETYKNDIL